MGEIFQILAHTLVLLSVLSIGNQGLAQHNLSVQIEHLSSCVSTQDVDQVITPFEGDPKGFKDWIKAVEKYALVKVQRGIRLNSHISLVRVR